MKANQKNKLPQEGTCCSAVGESLTEQSSVSPTYSEGGIDRSKSQSDFYPSFKGALSQGGSLTGDEESLGIIPSTSAAPEPITQKVTKGVLTRAHFVRPPTLVADEMVSDTSESSFSQMSCASETSTKSSRTRGRKRTQKRGSDELTATKKIAAKQLSLSIEPQTGGGEEKSRDSELASPPTKQAKTRASVGQSLPELQTLAKTMQAQPTTELSTCINDSLRTIEEVANGSRNLKSSFVHSLRLAALTVQAAVAELATRSAVEVNVERLEAENADLKARLTSLSAQVEKLTAQVSLLSRKEDQMASPTLAASLTGPTQVTAATGIFRSDESEAQFRRSIALEIGGMMDAKLAALEQRLPREKPVRPPLAADAKKTSAPVAQAMATVDLSPKPTKKKRKGKGKGKAVAPVVEQPDVPAVPTQALQASKTEKETWSTVVGRKARKEKTPQSSANQGAPFASPRSTMNTKEPVKLPRVPTTAAITVSVRQGSSAKLGEVMFALRQRIRLADFGIETVGQKRAADGGMIITIAGAESSNKADKLASCMREVLAEFDVKISRPTKRAEARIMDLDDAVTSEEVAAAIAGAGGCSTEDVKVGEIRRPPASLGHVWVRAPLAAIKKLASDKRMRLGWTSVRVQVLGARRMMCFRCLEPGHVRNQCTSVVDRSSLCYACGGAHKARECTSPTLRCSVCADQGLPSDHRLGGKKCAPRKKRALLAPATSQSSTLAPLSAGPAEEMDTSPSQS